MNTLVLAARFETPLPDDTWERLLEKLPHPMGERAKRYRRWQDRHAALFGKLLVREGLKRYGVAGDALTRLRTTAHDRPYLEGGPDFNLSHSGTLAACAFCDERIGLDVEKEAPVDLSDFRRVFDDHEWAALERAEDPECEFFRLWTRKESVVKADGRGVTFDLTSIRWDGDVAEVEGKRYFTRELDLADGYACHLASTVPLTAVDIDYVDLIQEGGGEA